MSKRTGAIIGAALAFFLLIASLGWWVLVGNVNGEYFTQVDNSKTSQLESKGGVIDPTGGMKIEYRLPAYNESGDEREIAFGTDRELREGAYLKLEAEPIRGVVGWSEVQYDDLPPKVQAQMR